MKRMMVSLLVIAALTVALITSVFFFTNHFTNGMTARIEALEAASAQNTPDCAAELIEFFNRERLLAWLIFPANKLDEMAMLLEKMSAYIEAGDESEAHATAAELKSRILLLRFAETGTLPKPGA